jgi:hypothetical protein
VAEGVEDEGDLDGEKSAAGVGEERLELGIV